MSVETTKTRVDAAIDGMSCSTMTKLRAVVTRRRFWCRVVICRVHISVAVLHCNSN